MSIFLCFFRNFIRIELVFYILSKAPFRHRFGPVLVPYRDKSGKLLFRLKSFVDTFSYKFKETDPETGEEKEIENIFEFTMLIDS